MQQECLELFGAERLQRAWLMPTDELRAHAGAIAAVARLLLQFDSNQARQIQIVRGMPEPVAAGLCRWLIDPFWDAEAEA